MGVAYLVILLLKLGSNLLSLFIGACSKNRHDGVLVTACGEMGEVAALSEIYKDKYNLDNNTAIKY